MIRRVAALALFLIVAPTLAFVQAMSAWPNEDARPAMAEVIRDVEATMTSATVMPTVVAALPTAQPAALVGDAMRGAQIFAEGADGAPACRTCHSLNRTGMRGQFAPVLAGVSAQAGQRVEGMTAEQYLEQSIRQPAAFVVGGFANMMYAHYGTQYDEQTIADLVAYLMTL